MRSRHESTRIVRFVKMNKEPQPQHGFFAPERPKRAVSRLMDAAPDVIAGQPDMLPAERREMFDGFRSHIAALAVQLSKRVFEINSIMPPENASASSNTIRDGDGQPTPEIAALIPFRLYYAKGYDGYFRL